MVATAVSALVGAVVAVALAIGGTAVATPSEHAPVPPSQMVKYGDNGHL